MGQHRRNPGRKRLTVSVAVPTIPGREALYRRAVASVHAQTRQPDRILVDRDEGRSGAAAARNRLLARVDTDLVAWLDDDDHLLPRHIDVLARTFEADPGVDLVYPVPVMEHGFDPTATTYQGMWPYSPWGLRWCPEFEEHIRVRGSFIPITHMVRAETARRAGGFPEGEVLPDGRYRGEDEGYLLNLLDAGARFHHVNCKTWIWFVNPSSTAGKPRVTELTS
jgi:glycosyltransferase involved in cell wall biosynthesis